jgi:hypothetical protein
MGAKNVPQCLSRLDIISLNLLTLRDNSCLKKQGLILELPLLIANSSHTAGKSNKNHLAR